MSLKAMLWLAVGLTAAAFLYNGVAGCLWLCALCIPICVVACVLTIIVNLFR